MDLVFRQNENCWDISARIDIPASWIPAIPAGMTAYRLGFSSSRAVHPHFGEDGEFFAHGLQAFLKEAKTLARFDHPHIVKPLNVYLTHFAHDRRIERPILLDFGAARLSLGGQSRSLSVMYTPDFAAPEQEHTRGQGPWTDVYGLAATLYRMVTGAPPLKATIRFLDDRLEDPRKSVPELSDRFADALLKGLILHPGQRPQTVAEFRSLLTAPEDERSSDHASQQSEPAAIVEPEPQSRPADSDDTVLPPVKKLSPKTPTTGRGTLGLRSFWMLRVLKKLRAR